MRRRTNIFIIMQLLELLMEEPRGPTRLAQAANLNYQTCEGYLAILLADDLVAKDSREEHEVYSATPKGKDLFFRWEKIYEELDLP